MPRLSRDLVTSALAIVAFTLVTGLVYPLALTGIARVVSPGKANGSRIEHGDKVVGSRLIGQPFSLPVLDRHGKPSKDSDGNPVTRPNPRYFQPRPSQTTYDPSTTAFSNRGPNQASARKFYREQLNAYLLLERRYTGGLSASRVPVDAVTTSASGVDPHISPANARIQAHRIARIRRLTVSRVNALIARHTDGRFLGLLGEPGVNVLELNLALDGNAR
jgi:potassium-transporting ATPase KdpC subunit